MGDKPLADHDEGQPKSKDIQKVLKLVRNQLEAQEDYFPILPTKSLAFLTLVPN